MYKTTGNIYIQVDMYLTLYITKILISLKHRRPTFTIGNTSMNNFWPLYETHSNSTFTGTYFILKPPNLIDHSNPIYNAFLFYFFSKN